MLKITRAGNFPAPSPSLENYAQIFVFKLFKIACRIQRYRRFDFGKAATVVTVLNSIEKSITINQTKEN